MEITIDKYLFEHKISAEQFRLIVDEVLDLAKECEIGNICSLTQAIFPKLSPKDSVKIMVLQGLLLSVAKESMPRIDYAI